MVRRAGKSQIYVILDAADYHQKTKAILADQSKFKRITRNPVEQLKKDANNLIDAANKHSNSMKLTRITGEYKPGCFYGSVKTHKPGNPLRPIISQVPLPTYQLAKTLNGIMYPYVPLAHSLKSPSECIDILKNRKRQGTLASLDTSSLYTNVPIERTIDILVRYAYYSDDMSPPDIPEHIMRVLLRLCMTKAPFKCPEGKLYYQVDGIAMGSPLGVLFAQAFMASVEAEVLSDESIRPFMYSRYIDDILSDVRDNNSLDMLKRRLEETSGLQFTVENSVQNRISFFWILT